jgi:phosphate binding protein
MSVMKNQARTTLLLSLIVGTFLVACGGATTSTPGDVSSASAPRPTAVIPAAAQAADGELPEVDPAAISGPISIAGSSTVFPLTAAVAEAFRDAGSSAQISIDSIGTGAGFQRFCGGAELDIVDASRAINPEEQARCEQRGRNVVEFRIGTDALAVVVHKDNTFLEALSFAQLADIFSGKAKTWADVDSNFPPQPIALYSPGTASGTYDYFVETILGDDTTRMASAATMSEDDDVLADGVADNRYAIGYFGFAYYQKNTQRLKVLKIDDGTGKGSVAPAAESAADGSYPLARPLYVYSTAEVLKAEPHVAAFINFYLTNVNDFIEVVGYFPASPAASQEARQNYLAALK